MSPCRSGSSSSKRRWSGSTDTKFAFGPRYVVVNLPATYAEAIENDVVVRRYRVVVGKTEKPSPTLTAEITSVVLNPTWTVPASIAKSGNLRAYAQGSRLSLAHAHGGARRARQADRSAFGGLVRHAYAEFHGAPAVRHIQRARRRQDRHAEPLFGLHARHQQRSLFANDYRFDSHGCSRVDNVRDLAAWLLKDQPKWNRAAIDATIASGQHLEVPVSKKVPVAWVYLTAWMNKDQTVHFRNDVYAQDEHLHEATAEEAAFLNKAADHPLSAHLVQ